jgi:hypothetical protein
VSAAVVRLFDAARERPVRVNALVAMLFEWRRGAYRPVRVSSPVVTLLSRAGGATAGCAGRATPATKRKTAPSALRLGRRVPPNVFRDSFHHFFPSGARATRAAIESRHQRSVLDRPPSLFLRLRHLDRRGGAAAFRRIEPAAKKRNRCAHPLRPVRPSRPGRKSRRLRADSRVDTLVVSQSEVAGFLPMAECMGVMESVLRTLERGQIS